jgi:hypothetical protein
MKPTPLTVDQYFAEQVSPAQAICLELKTLLDNHMPQTSCRLYHGAPVWFDGDNPLAGVTVLAKGGVQLLFWSGQSFDGAGDAKPELKATGKFKAAEARFDALTQLDRPTVERWLHQGLSVQWDYARIRENGGVLVRRG